ncbi:uncharacterized protein PgNI_08002 [Pyricularia grisea]|uniref:Uncharacterized protein n=1 Tax=Pyricularia grisea TaxID=148305 RepID=A0A6P8AVD8_PYRGI|nr:uncharacterized protein PgNI_08002 [Pyricularia grisea]TLD06160.1 hypothetical protein PgNI_08002 [Pyricularia grisea]
MESNTTATNGTYVVDEESANPGTAMSVEQVAGNGGSSGDPKEEDGDESSSLRSPIITLI